MTDYTTELLHISSYVIGILLGALICTIVMVFYYRRKLRSAQSTDEDLMTFSHLDFPQETTDYMEPTPAVEDDGAGDATGQREEQPADDEPADDEPEKVPDGEEPGAEHRETFSPPPPNRRTTKAEAAEERLYKHITTTIVKERLYLKPGFGRSDIVERFEISAHRAGMIFSKRQTSIPEFVRNCRLDHACQQMKDEPLANLSDIATASGFSFVSSFIRDFKNRYGMTPARFRETLQSNESETE
jgi:AraC-like DNA-binding protein